MLVLGLLLQAGGLGRLGAATLQRLSLEDMVSKSTGIVRGRVSASYAARYGAVIYTHYQLAVAERWKGTGSAVVDVVLPGGEAGGLRQTFPGTPTLAPGSEYVLFLWTSPKSGLTHIIGLTQGLFDIQRGPDGELLVLRNASSGVMLDASGGLTRDSALSMRLSELRQRVYIALAQGGRR